MGSICQTSRNGAMDGIRGLVVLIVFHLKLREFVKTRPHFIFLDPFDALCDGNYCKVVEGGNLYYSDHAYLTSAGAKLVVNKHSEKILEAIRSSGLMRESANGI